MLSLRSSLILAAVGAALSALPVQAQPEVPVKRVPAPAKAPVINPEARKLMEAMIAKYQGLKSYSDKTRVTLEGGGALPGEMRQGYPVEATLAWQRPSNLRFEGQAGTKSFLALSNQDKRWAINPSYPGLWVEHAQETPARLDAAVFEAGPSALGMAFMTEPEFWTRTLKDVTVLILEPDAEADQTPCRVVNVQAEGDEGNTTLMRLWIGRDDSLLRRFEISDSQMGADSKFVETHSEMRANPDLPATTWEFHPPAASKKVENFPYPKRTDRLNIKVGDTLPAFSGEDLQGNPLELNSKDGKATLLYFFSIRSATYDADTLQRLHAALGSKGLRIIGVSGDGRRDRVEQFARDHKLTFPIYFDEGAMSNRLAGLFGVGSWPTTLLFDREGKLTTSSSWMNSADVSEGLNKLFPQGKVDALTFEDENFHPDRPAPDPK